MEAWGTQRGSPALFWGEVDVYVNPENTVCSTVDRHAAPCAAHNTPNAGAHSDKVET